MANPDHEKVFRQGAKVWNEWRETFPQIMPDLSGARLAWSGTNPNIKGRQLRKMNLSNTNLQGNYFGMMNLSGIDLRGSNLDNVDFEFTSLINANLAGASLINANLGSAHLNDSNLEYANLQNANLSAAIAPDARFDGANLQSANLTSSALISARMINANLCEAKLVVANLIQANLTEANLKGADLSGANLTGANFERADLSNCRVFGTSVWGVKLDGAKQLNLVITSAGEASITVDNLEVAQFIYLLLENKKIRNVIDTVARKMVLILGRFTPERKEILEAISTEIRKHDYLPIVIDFEKPESRDITETVRTLAHLSRFVIADITSPMSIPLELQAIVPDLAVPVQPIILRGEREFSMFADLRKKYHWVLATRKYRDKEELVASIDNKVIAPAEKKARELERR